MRITSTVPRNRPESFIRTHTTLAGRLFPRTTARRVAPTSPTWRRSHATLLRRAGLLLLPAPEPRARSSRCTVSQGVWFPTAGTVELSEVRWKWLPLFPIGSKDVEHSEQVLPLGLQPGASIEGVGS